MAQQIETDSGLSPRGGHALLIGIDRYVSAPSLNGCGNDVQLMASVLPRFGFPPDRIHRLVDAAATRQAVMAKLEDLSHVSAPQETVFVHFSGWGLRIPKGVSGSEGIISPWTTLAKSAYLTQQNWMARSKYSSSKGVPGGDSLDQMMSALVPHDWDGTPNAAITYDALLTWTLQIPDRNVVLVIDAPYAGGLVAESQSLPSGHIFIGASRYDEICSEFQAASGVYQGALTYYLAQALIEAAPGATYRDIFYRVSANVSARSANQHPQLQGSADLPLFATGQPASTRLTTVKSREGYRVTLGVGAAQGATVKSQWAIYPEAAADAGAQKMKIGLAEITAVRAAEADARILSESGHLIIQPGATATEEAHFYGEMRLAVCIKVPPDDYGFFRDGLARLLVGSELVTLIESEADPGAADVIVHLLPPRNSAAETDPVPQVDQVDELIWAAVDRFGALIMPPVAAAGSSTVYEVRDRLENLSRYRNVLGLRNPNLGSPLAGKVHFAILRRRDDEWMPAEADRHDGLPVFHEGERIALEIKNDHSESIYVGVLDFGLTASVSMLYPSDGPTEEIRPGQSLHLGTQSWDGIELYLPDGFSGAGESEEQDEIGGVETLKLFATAYQTDLGRLMLQEGGRGIYNSRGEGTALWQLLDMALTGVGSRELKPVQLPPEQEWTTVERAFVLRHRR